VSCLPRCDDPDQASEVASLFKVLANESRLRILHALTRTDELCVGDIAEAVGMSTQAISNQLRRLVDRRVVATRRDGNYIVYRPDRSLRAWVAGIGLVPGRRDRPPG
jgi:DNA-binding transcriptional ArsR family regulator